MHIREKIAHVVDMKHVKHSAIARSLGISRQAFSRRLRKGEFTEAEISIIADELNITKEALERVDPARTASVLNDVQHSQEHVVFSYVMNFTINNTDEETSRRLLSIVKELHEMNRSQLSE